MSRVSIEVNKNVVQEELKDLLLAAVLTKVDVLNEEMELPEEAGSIEEIDQDILDFAIMYRNIIKDVPVSDWSPSQQYKLQSISLLIKFREKGAI